MIPVNDSGCQTEANVADFFVGSEGELARKGVYLSEVSSMNISDLANRLGFSWEKVCQYRTGKENAEARRWAKAQEDEWERLYREHLTKKEYNFVRKVFEFQKNVDFGRFRVYAEIRKGHPRIILCTEFIQFCDEDDFWTEFNTLAKALKANVWVMREAEHLDHSYRVNPDNNQKYDEHFGVNHGRMERQVELSWRVEKMPIAEFREVLIGLRKQTQELWDLSGVGVC